MASRDHDKDSGRDQSPARETLLTNDEVSGLASLFAATLEASKERVSDRPFSINPAQPSSIPPRPARDQLHQTSLNVPWQTAPATNSTPKRDTLRGVAPCANATRSKRAAFAAQFLEQEGRDTGHSGGANDGPSAIITPLRPAPPAADRIPQAVRQSAPDIPGSTTDDITSVSVPSSAASGPARSKGASRWLVMLASVALGAGFFYAASARKPHGEVGVERSAAAISRPPSSTAASAAQQGAEDDVPAKPVAVPLPPADSVAEDDSSATHPGTNTEQANQLTTAPARVGPGSRREDIAKSSNTAESDKPKKPLLPFPESASESARDPNSIVRKTPF